MIKRQKNQLIRWAVFWLATFATAFSWLQIFWPPISFYRRSHGVGARATFAELLKWDNSIYGFPASGYVFLILTAILSLIAIALIRAIGNYLENSQVGISLLETRMDLIMEDEDRRRATMCRDQVFHANRADVTAYHLIHKADAPNAHIEDDSIHLESLVGGKVITKELLKRGNGKSKDVIEVYKSPLPTSLFATYLPNWIVALLQNTPLFDGVLVKRKGRIVYVDEYSGDESILSITSLRYPVINTKITISFITGSEPDRSDVRAFLIQENAVEEIGVSSQTSGNRTIFEVNARSLYRETLRIQWVNRPAPGNQTQGRQRQGMRKASR